MVKDTLSDDEATSKRSPALATLLLHALKDVFQALHVVMVVPTDCAARDLQAFLDREVDAAIGDNHVTTLTEGRDDRADGRERLRVENGCLRPQEVGDVLLQLDVHVCERDAVSARNALCVASITGERMQVNGRRFEWFGEGRVTIAEVGLRDKDRVRDIP